MKKHKNGRFPQKNQMLLFKIFLALAVIQNWTTTADSGIRLAGSGSTSFKGRVEVFHNGQWGTVCDDKFNENTNGATVVCKMLGFSFGISNLEYGSGTGQIWLDQVECAGTESSIINCPHSAWGNNDCSHSEDVGVVCSESLTCLSGWWKCANEVQCIRNHWRCDGSRGRFEDCVDESDELNCESITCLSGWWKCANGKQCIDIWRRCNGHNECEDYSDEQNCEAYTCPAGRSKCADGSQCFYNSQKCNGRNNCDDGTDELNCTVITCNDNMMLCDDGLECMWKDSRCTGMDSCRDGSDELNCESCVATGFHCQGDNKCISTGCDGINDCTDGSDEENCGACPPFQRSDPMFVWLANATWGNSSYFLGRAEKTWADAREACLNACGDLASLETFEELEIVYGEVQRVVGEAWKFWVGAKRVKMTLEFEWMSGSRLEEDDMAWSQYYGRQPMDAEGGQHCVRLKSTGGPGDAYYADTCNFTYHAICEMPASVSTQPPSTSLPDIDKCFSNPCSNGVCKDKVNSYECDCTGTRFTGDKCETTWTIQHQQEIRNAKLQFDLTSAKPREKRTRQGKKIFRKNYMNLREKIINAQKFLLSNNAYRTKKTFKSLIEAIRQATKTLNHAKAWMKQSGRLQRH